MDDGIMDLSPVKDVVNVEDDALENQIDEWRKKREGLINCKERQAESSRNQIVDVRYDTVDDLSGDTQFRDNTQVAENVQEAD